MMLPNFIEFRSWRGNAATKLEIQIELCDLLTFVIILIIIDPASSRLQQILYACAFIYSQCF